jgi:cytoskeletal protein CcmA (bactofilin family)
MHQTVSKEISNKNPNKPSSQPPVPSLPPANAEAEEQRPSFFQRIGASFQDKIQTSRGGMDRPFEPLTEAPVSQPVTDDDAALRRAKSGGLRRMVVPEGVVIGGSVTSNAETEISGRIDGDVTVDGRLFLGETAVISGNIRAVMCRIEGRVEGKIECSQEIDLGRTGRLNSDAVAGRKITVAGQVFGNMTTGGMLQLVTTGRIEGNIHIRQLVIEEGATFNGSCMMRKPPAQRNGQ